MILNLPDLKPHVHFDIPMECAILGAITLEPPAFGRVRGLLTADCFYIEANKIVYQILTEMWQNQFPIDIFTVVSYLASNKKMDELAGRGVAAYIAKLQNNVTSTANLEYYCLIIRQLYAEREILKVKYNSNETGGDVLARTEKMREDLFKISQIKVVNDWKDMVEVVMELHKHMDKVHGKDIIGIPWGFKRIDKITSGLQNGDLTILAARPSVGKSALLGKMVVSQAQKGFKVGIISLEMSNVQLGARMGALVSDMEFYRIFRSLVDDEQEKEKLYSDLEDLALLPIKISDKTKVNINDIRAKVGQLKSKGEIDILYVDYLQLLDSDDSHNRNFNREQQVSQMSRGFKLMAKEFDLPVVVLAQLNRESEKLTSKKPQLHHLRESGAIEQDADLVTFLHRDFKSGILIDANGNSTVNNADLIIAKGRNIETADIQIGFEPAKMKFYDLDTHYVPVSQQLPDYTDETPF